MTRVTVQTAGVHYKWQMPDQLTQQLRLAHDLREDLVTLEYEYEDAVKAVWSSYPAVAALEAQVAELDERASELASTVKEEKSRQRTKRPSHPAVAQLAETRAQLKAAKASRREAIASVRDEATERLRTISDERYAAQKQLYRDYCTDGLLYWATFNAVLDHHKTAVKRIAAHRKQGRAAQLRHHRWDGTGTISVQLQRQATDPARTPAIIADADTGKWRSSLIVPWVNPDVWDTMDRASRRKAGRVVIRMRCGSSRNPDGTKTSEWIDVPVQQHRMLPADADITAAQLTVRREGADLRATIGITAKIPDQGEVDEGPTIAVHLGWRSSDHGTVVATWRSTEPLDIPETLRGVITTQSAERTVGSIVVPHRIEQRVHHHATVASHRDLAVDSIRDTLVAWLTEHGPQPHPYDGDPITAASVQRWKAPRRFAWLALQWRDTPPPEGADIAETLEAWRRADKKLWLESEHGRGRALRHRTDLHRQVAAYFAGVAGRIVVDDSDIAQIAGTAKHSELLTDVDRQIARRRAIAAPGMLRAAIVAAATRDEVPTTTVSHTGLSRVHAACGHENPADDRYLMQPVLCDGCGRTYDTDLSATILMLQRASAATSN
ncbi:hypothetical protein GOOTI_202_00040 [Gordonia otitidis NBRC 100426]|uniref:CRISPR-associated DNA-binding protein Cas12m n=2 Tax=Gordonia otitidis (strain DSM 44809 / CCUG 52243 / JCM 12355 / NBRC 100426 / IFM 10032) TaxID=1108044 RepID=CS12M_GORO1|nr:hypothetical protein GOOTI_202_00040 [Gordonia otitidis NBRC 100426]